MQSKNKLPFSLVVILCALMLSLAFPMNAQAHNYSLTMMNDQCPTGYTGTYPACVPLVRGCTFPGAANFNPNATADDGSCKSALTVVNGCTNPGAVNYNPNAAADDGSCKSALTVVNGCTIPSAKNYNPNATMDNGSCTP